MQSPTHLDLAHSRERCLAPHYPHIDQAGDYVCHHVIVPEPQVITKEVVKEVIKEVQKEVPKEVTKTVTVENVGPITYAAIGVAVVMAVVAVVALMRKKST